MTFFSPAISRPKGLKFFQKQSEREGWVVNVNEGLPSLVSYVRQKFRRAPFPIYLKEKDFPLLYFFCLAMTHG